MTEITQSSNSHLSHISVQADMPTFNKGEVWLVGAGPGDPGLLTLNAVHALQNADVVVYDALVDTRCLSFLKSAAIVEYAGKRGGKPSPKQRDISLRLVELAQKGLRVLRLKGGDPFVFGRGGEEALTLVSHNIPFRVVPGITAGIGGLAYAGIPVTHRDINQTVLFLTGHDQTGVLPGKIDWQAVTKAAPVIVMYMAMKHLPAIQKALLENGRNPEEAAAIVTQASTQDQQVLVTNLNDIVLDAEAAHMKPPSIVVFGEVVRLREGLNWLDGLNGLALNPDPLGLRGSEESLVG